MTFWGLMLLFIVCGLFWVIGNWLYESCVHAALQDKLQCKNQQESSIARLQKIQEEIDVMDGGYVSD
jgi:hypothetical protein